MPTNAGNTIPDARQLHTQQVHYVRRNIGFEEIGKKLSIGKLPAGSVIMKSASGVQTNVPFNSGTTNAVDIGTDATGNFFGSALSTGSANFVPIGQNVSEYLAVDTEIFVTVNGTGTAATAGRAAVFVCFIPNNDLRIENV